MHKKVFAAVLVSLLVGSVVVAPAAQGLEVSGLAHKILSGPDVDGDLAISIKVSVLNSTDTDQQAMVIVRAVDKEEYEVFEAHLNAKIKAGQLRILTDSHFIGEDLYNSIARWEVEE